MGLSGGITINARQLTTRSLVTCGWGGRPSPPRDPRATAPSRRHGADRPVAMPWARAALPARPIGDDRRNRPSRRDDESLARGWPMGVGGSRTPVGLWCRLAGSRLGGAGRRPGRRWCSTDGPCGSTGIGIAIGRGLGTNHINGSITALRPCQRRRKATYWGRLSGGTGTRGTSPGATREGTV